MNKRYSLEEIERWIEHAKMVDKDYQARSLGEIRYLYEKGRYPGKLHVSIIKLKNDIIGDARDMWEVTPLLSISIVIQIILITCLLIEELLK